MTLHTKVRVQQVGVRDLHDRLSQHLRHVADGGEIVVTSRGKRVARITPIDPVDPLDELRRQGMVREPIRPKSVQTGRKRPKVKGSVSDIVVEQRRR